MLEVYHVDGNFRIVNYVSRIKPTQYIEHRCLEHKGTQRQPYSWNPRYAGRKCHDCKTKPSDGLQACFWFISSRGMNDV